VMSRNLYLGAALDDVIAGTSFAEFLTATRAGAGRGGVTPRGVRRISSIRIARRFE